MGTSRNPGKSLSLLIKHTSIHSMESKFFVSPLMYDVLLSYRNDFKANLII